MLQLGVPLEAARGVDWIQNLHAAADQPQHEPVLELNPQRRRRSAFDLEVGNRDPRPGVRRRRQTGGGK